MAADKHEAYYVRTGSGEWGDTYTVYVWDSDKNIYRELTTNVSLSEAKRMIKNK